MPKTEPNCSAEQLKQLLKSLEIVPCPRAVQQKILSELKKDDAR